MEPEDTDTRSEQIKGPILAPPGSWETPTDANKTSDEYRYWNFMVF